MSAGRSRATVAVDLGRVSDELTKRHPGYFHFVSGVLRDAAEHTSKWRAVVLNAVADQIDAQLSPKPAEPTGLGAVVRDREGKLWVRCDEDYDRVRWHSPHGDGKRYEEIHAVVVLAEGITR